MVLPVGSETGSKGHLIIGGCDTVQLKKKYGTPLYIMDIATIKDQARSYIKNFNFPDVDVDIVYASKAFSCTAMCELMKKEGFGIDISTGGELFIALNSGFPPGKILFHGSNKSLDEIEEGLFSRAGFFIVDNFSELETLDRLCGEKKIKQKIMLRITPGVKASTHEYIQTGKIKSKFGFGISDGLAIKAIEEAARSKNLELTGIHAHIGSQIFNLSSYDKLIEIMLKLIKDARDRLKVTIASLNIGGGLGIKYVPEDKPSSIEDLAGVVSGALKKYQEKYALKLDRLYLEPGRSIVGNAGVTLYEVGAVKEIKSVINYISIDGGMSDNIRPMLYQAGYDAFLANRMKDSQDTGEDKKKHYSIVGKHCESGDVIIEDIKLPPVAKGDLIAVAATGAYCYSMASNYNGQPKSAVIAVEDGKSWTWVKRQAYKDLIKGDKRLYEE